MVRTKFFKRKQKDHIKKDTLHVYKVSENGIAHICVDYSTINILLDVNGIKTTPTAPNFDDATEISEHDWLNYRDQVINKIDSI